MLTLEHDDNAMTDAVKKIKTLTFGLLMFSSSNYFIDWSWMNEVTGISPTVNCVTLYHFDRLSSDRIEIDV